MKHFLLGCGVGIVISVALAVCVVLIAITFFQDYFIEKKTEHLKRPPMPMDAPVEYGWTIKTLEGETLSMETFKGKTVFTVFWSPDCFSCLAELGGIQRLYDKTRDLGVEFACMSVGEDEEELRTVLEEREFTVPVYVTTKDRPEMFKAGSIPSAYIFSAEGTLAFEHVGALNWDDERCIKYLEKLSLREASEEPADAESP